MKRHIIISLLIIGTIFSCVRKKDFEYDKIIWDDVTPTWGIPLVNTVMSVSEAVNKNKSTVVVEVGSDGLITFIYRDTVISPTGDSLFGKLDFPENIEFKPSFSFGVVPLSKGDNRRIPDMTGFVPFEMDNSDLVNELSFKSGILNLIGNSSYQHDISFRLTLPDLQDQNGASYSKDFNFVYSTTPQITDGPTSLAGYKLKAASGQKNKLAFSLSNITILAKDNGVVANPVLPTDSLKFNILLSQIQYKYVIGKFNPLIFETPFLSGSTEIAVFKNSVEADIRFADPSVEFDFQNSFGVIPSIYIKNAIMDYSDFKKDSLNVNAPFMNIPGNTTLTKSNNIGQFVSTKIVVDKSTSNIVSILNGAPNKFSFKIPFIELAPASDNQAFISNDSQIKVYTNVRLPMFGAIHYLSLTDTIRDVQMVKPEHVEYVEFRLGSENSIPLAATLQVYFSDTNVRVQKANGKIQYKIIDSLISPPVSEVIIDPATFDVNNLAVTRSTTLDRTISIDKEKYGRISTSNIIIVKGTLLTPDASNTNVKFTVNQTLTFKLSALAKVRVNPGHLTEDDLITKKKP